MIYAFISKYLISGDSHALKFPITFRYKVKYDIRRQLLFIQCIMQDLQTLSIDQESLSLPAGNLSVYDIVIYINVSVAL